MTAGQREKAVQDFIAAVNQATDILSGVTDEDSATFAVRGCKKSFADFRPSPSWPTVGAPTGDEAKMLQEKYEAPVKGATARLQKEASRVNAFPAPEEGAGEALKVLSA